MLPPPESKSTVTSWPTRCSGELEQYHPNYIPLLLAEIPVSNIRFPLTFSILSCADGRDRTYLSAQSNRGAALLHCASAYKIRRPEKTSSQKTGRRLRSGLIQTYHLCLGWIGQGISSLMQRAYLSTSVVVMQVWLDASRLPVQTSFHDFEQSRCGRGSAPLAAAGCASSCPAPHEKPPR